MNPGVAFASSFYRKCALAFRGRAMRRGLAVAGLAAIFTGCLVPSAQGAKKKGPPRATASYSPMPLDSGYGPLNTDEPATPADEIIHKFEEKETEFRRALSHYTYRRTVRVQTIDDDNKVDGEYYQVDDVTFDPSGRRTEKVVYAPENSLSRISMSPADFSDIQDRLPFVLTTQDAGQYNVEFVGRQKVDQVDCYVFNVAPKQIEKGKRYFQGKIWVDAEELQIVITSGKNVPDDLRSGHEDLSTPFTTYREQVDGENWFPTYSKGDGVLHFPGGRGNLAQDVHIRQTVKFTDYKQYGSSSTIIYNGQEIDKSDAAKPDASKPDGSKPDATKPQQPQQPH